MITGNVILNEVPGYSFGLFAFVLFAVGTFLVGHETNVENKFDRILQEYQKGKSNAIETANELNEVIPIQNVKYATGKKHTLFGKVNAYTLPIRKGKKSCRISNCWIFVCIEK